MTPNIVTVIGNTPEVDPEAFVAPGATVAGRVRLEGGASVWFGCVVRGEYEDVHIGRDSNVQDLSAVHADPGFPVRIGERVTIGHRSVIHGCTIEDDALIGMGAVVMNGAVVGEGAVIGAGAVVTEGTRIPPRCLAVGVPAKVREGASVPDVPRDNVAAYVHFAEEYAKSFADGG